MIALLTDFGNKDGAVASMKGVIKSINLKVDLIDISHDISPFSIEEGAFVLLRAYSYFPKNTIFLCVVDPGVGSKRKAILLYNEDYYFIGPDNGLFSYILTELSGCNGIKLTNSYSHLNKVSSTFHGRDIFSPVAGHLSLNVSPKQMGEEFNNFKSFVVQKAGKVSDNVYQGQLIFFDAFGNAYSNLTKDILLDKAYKSCKIKINNQPISTNFKFGKCYNDVKQGEYLSYFGNSGFLELAESQGDIQSRYKLKIGDQVTISGY